MGFCPMAWASPMFALMTSVKGLGTPWGDRDRVRDGDRDGDWDGFKDGDGDWDWGQTLGQGWGW